MLAASVSSRRTSESPNAFSRSMFCSVMRPRTCSPDMRGTKTAHFTSAPATVYEPTSAARSRKRSFTTTVRRVCIICAANPLPPTLNGAGRKRSPFSQR